LIFVLSQLCFDCWEVHWILHDSGVVRDL
jgi:hypothetical protein